MPRCKECKEKFDVKYSFQKFCMKKDECISAHVEFAKEQKYKQKQKAWNKRKKEIKEKIKTRSDYLKEAQSVFNKFIRLRDKDEPCISCKKPLKTNATDAGHYRSVGGCPELRFNELNNHAQCVFCNRYLSANLINYRINLIKKIGLEDVEFLEGNHEPLKLSIDEIKAIKAKYKKKCKELE